MTDTEILERLTGVFRDIFQDSSLVVTPEMMADDVERWDSLSHIDMIVMVEEEFGIKFQTSQVNGMKNVGDLVALIKAKSR